MFRRSNEHLLLDCEQILQNRGRKPNYFLFKGLRRGEFHIIGGRESLYFPLLKLAKRPRGPLGQNVFIQLILSPIVGMRKGHPFLSVGGTRKGYFFCQTKSVKGRLFKRRLT